MKLAQPITTLRRRHPHEWLLIEVTRVHRATSTPVAGRLLAHHRRRSVIDRQSLEAPSNSLLVYADDRLPHGYAAAF